MRLGGALYGTPPSQGGNLAGGAGVSPKPGPRSPGTENRIRQTKTVIFKIVIENEILIPAPPLPLVKSCVSRPLPAPAPGWEGGKSSHGSLAVAVVSSLFQSEMLETEEEDELSTPVVVDSQES